MTTAERLGELPVPDRHWLVEYVKLQRTADKRVEQALLDAVGQADRVMAGYTGKTGVTATVRTAQMMAAKNAIYKVLHKLFLEVGNITRAEQANAASLAEDLMIEDESGLWKMILPDQRVRKETLDAMRTAASRNIQSVMTRIFLTEQTLSRRVYKSEALAKGQVNKVVNRHIAIGSSTEDIAKDVRGLIRPDVPGGVSYRAKTLARTEINNAFHAQSIADMKDRPWIQQAQWNLSKSHEEEGCVCEKYARIRYFFVDSVPKKPHPGCLCSITPVLPDIDTALNNFMAGQYAPWLPSLTEVS